jgi:transcriptional repressor NrdR
MKCPFCGFLEDRVLESRGIREGESIKRRRECLGCARRYTTYEQIEERRVAVVKKDGRREPFDRVKILRGLELACRKRPVPTAALEELVDEIERRFYDAGETEIASTRIGELVVEGLRSLDPVAYVRYASVHGDFQNLTQFRELLDILRPETRIPSGRRRTPSRKLPVG